MAYQILMSEEELGQFEHMIRHELETSHHELRRTRNPNFRAQVLRRIELAEGMLHSCQEAHTKPAG